MGLRWGMELIEAVRLRSLGKVPQPSQCHCCKERQDQQCHIRGLWVRIGHGMVQDEPNPTGQKTRIAICGFFTGHSRVPPVDRDVVVVRILDHCHAADRRVEHVRDERHGPLLHLLHKGIEV